MQVDGGYTHYVVLNISEARGKMDVESRAQMKATGPCLNTMTAVCMFHPQDR